MTFSPYIVAVLLCLPLAGCGDNDMGPLEVKSYPSSRYIAPLQTNPSERSVEAFFAAEALSLNWLAIELGEHALARGDSRINRERAARLADTHRILNSAIEQRVKEAGLSPIPVPHLQHQRVVIELEEQSGSGFEAALAAAQRQLYQEAVVLYGNYLEDEYLTVFDDLACAALPVLQQRLDLAQAGGELRLNARYEAPPENC